MQFYETKMGHAFFEHQVPQLITAVEKLAAALSRPSLPITVPEADPKFLHDLFFGSYEPEVYQVTPEIQQLGRAVSSAHVALAETLSEEGQKRLDAYEKALSERNAAVTELAYESGVRAAVQMIVAGLSRFAPGEEV
ncbi:DUF6809 family protein [Oscillibacter sp.]|uniref:DUF6809 family protein n=1 Tax=Oscillibacter sp. TaxID=1945593 RepID=UPI0025849A93|nr:DUF6809 family protein [Oscillibacter sp.]